MSFGIALLLNGYFQQLLQNHCLGMSLNTWHWQGDILYDPKKSCLSVPQINLQVMFCPTASDSWVNCMYEWLLFYSVFHFFPPFYHTFNKIAGLVCHLLCIYDDIHNWTQLVCCSFTVVTVEIQSSRSWGGKPVSQTHTFKVKVHSERGKNQVHNGMQALLSNNLQISIWAYLSWQGVNYLHLVHTVRHWVRHSRIILWYIL